MDIEAMLTWTYRDQLPKRGAVAASPAFAALERMAALGTAIDDDSAEPPGFPPGSGEPDPDAVLLDRAVRALEPTRLDWWRDGETVLPGLSALVNPAAVAKRVVNVGAEVTTWAKLSARPRVKTERFAPALTRVLDGAGRPVTLAAVIEIETSRGRKVTSVEPGTPGSREVLARYEASGGGRHGYRPWAFCPLAPDPDPMAVALDRLTYLAWWRALERLAMGGVPGLARKPTGPRAPMAPWR